jgi:hypothetical protein
MHELTGVPQSLNGLISLLPLNLKHGYSSIEGSRNNNFPEFAPRFGSDWGDLREHNRRRSKAYAEDCASKDRPKMA